MLGYILGFVLVPVSLLGADSKTDEGQAVNVEHLFIFIKIQKSCHRNGEKMNDCWRDLALRCMLCLLVVSVSI